MRAEVHVGLDLTKSKALVAGIRWGGKIKAGLCSSVLLAYRGNLKHFEQANRPTLLVTRMRDLISLPGCN